MGGNRAVAGDDSTVVLRPFLLDRCNLEDLVRPILSISAVLLLLEDEGNARPVMLYLGVTINNLPFNPNTAAI